MIPQEQIDEILRRADFVLIVGRYTQLKRQGGRFVGLCPFHNEKTPSFGVTPSRGVFKCFGCGEGGGLFQFLMKAEGTSFPETVVKLGEEVGVKVELESQDDPAIKRRKALLELLERTSHYYHELLMRSSVAEPALRYLDERGIDKKTMERFRLGWAPPSGQALAKKLEQGGYALQDGVAAGVLREKGGRYTDLMRGRIIFPIMDAHDKVLAFGGRVIDKESQPKYLNSPETELYSKRRHLFGLNVSRQAISKQDRALLVEGNFDVVSLHRVDVPIAVASLGTALTPEQAALLRKYTRNVVLAYDADRAGESATLKGIELFEQAGLRVAIAPMPPGEDPDSLARTSGKAGLESALENAIGVVDYLMDRWEKRLDLATPEGKEDFAREVLPAIEKIRDPVRRGAYMAKVADKLRVSEAKMEWKASSARQVVQRHRGRLDARQTEVGLLLVCLSNPEGMAWTLANLDPEQIQNERLKPIYRALFALGDLGRLPSWQDLEPHIEDPDALSDLTELLTREPVSSSLEDVEKHVKSIQGRHLKIREERLAREVVSLLEAGTLDPEDERVLELKRLRKLLKGAQQ